MPIEFENSELTELTPKITVVGVGGAGCNAVNNMIKAQLQGVDFVVANTDAQALANSGADNRIQLGVQITQGLGAGSQPKIGEAAAEEAIEDIERKLTGSHMAFVTAGMGGGTGTGAAPVIARMAREKGILTVGVVTKPFQFEGGRRMKIADSGIAELAKHVDTLIIIPNQNLFRVANERTTFADAFNMADEVLHSGVRSITDLMVMPGLINLDFADVRTVMSEMGKAMMGTGEADGEQRSVEAAAAAISNPLLEEVSLRGAKGVIINVTGGMDMTLYEVDEAVNMVREQADPDALIVFGSAFSSELEGKLRVSVVATGIEGGDTGIIPTPRRETVDVFAGTQTDEASAEEPSETAEEAVVEDSVDVEQVDGVETAAEENAEPVAEVQEAPAEDTPVEEVANPEDQAEEAAVEAAGGADTFVAEAPMEPKMRTPELAQANVFQEAAYASGSEDKEETAEEEAPAVEATEPQAEEPEKKRSLFRLMTASLRAAETGETTQAVNAPTPSNDEDVATATAEVEDVTTAPALGGVAAEDRPVETAKNKEQLEIPSFLRRQQ